MTPFIKQVDELVMRWGYVGMGKWLHVHKIMGFYHSPML